MIKRTSELPRRTLLGNSGALAHKKGPGLLRPSPSHTFLEALYLSRSLALPNLSLAVPLVWSERPSAFFSLSPVTAPVASLAFPFALSKAPSPLSWLLLFLPTCTFSLLSDFVTCNAILPSLQAAVGFFALSREEEEE